MDSSQFIWLAAATLGGGIAGSFGLNLLVQRTHLRTWIAKWRWWGIGLYYVVIAGGVFGGLAWMVRSVLASPTDVSSLGSPAVFLCFGFLVGLPFTLPLVTGIARGVNPGRKPVRTKPASRQERAEFAKDLERQLREFVEPTRAVHLELQGEDGEILVFGGDFTRQEGERLVAALRSDLVDLSVKRVEGGQEKGNWWVRVEEKPGSGKKKRKR